MRYIPSVFNVSEEFGKWITENERTLADLMASKNAGKLVFAHFKSNGPYHQVKRKLVQDQGYICCYCGKRIEVDHRTVIEHIKPKGKEEFKHLVLDLKNLAASCNGGSRPIVHIVDKHESLLDISKKYGVDIEHIEEVYTSIDEIAYLRRQYDLDNLKVGDRVVIFPKFDFKEQHCDSHKLGKTIDISPKDDKDCFNKFAFNEANGEIIITDENRKTVEVLGLNNNIYLNRLRVGSINAAIDLQQILIEDNPADIKEKLDKLIDNLSKVDNTNSRLEPFSFVMLNILLQ